MARQELDFNNIVKLIEDNKKDPNDLYRVFGDGELVSSFFTKEYESSPCTNLLWLYPKEMTDIFLWGLKASFKDQGFSSSMGWVLADMFFTLNMDNVKNLLVGIEKEGLGEIT